MSIGEKLSNIYDIMFFKLFHRMAIYIGHLRCPKSKNMPIARRVCRSPSDFFATWSILVSSKLLSRKNCIEVRARAGGLGLFGCSINNHKSTIWLAVQSTIECRLSQQSFQEKVLNIAAHIQRCMHIEPVRSYFINDTKVLMVYFLVIQNLDSF